MNDKDWKALQDAAQKLGAEAGENAAAFAEQYTTGGRTTTEKATYHAERILEMDEEGDPALWDYIPAVDLSGQWADGPTSSSILHEIIWEASPVEVVGDEPELTPIEADELVDTYVDAFSEAAHAEVMRQAAEFLK